MLISLLVALGGIVARCLRSTVQALPGRTVLLVGSLTAGVAVAIAPRVAAIAVAAMIAISIAAVTALLVANPLGESPAQSFALGKGPLVRAAGAPGPRVVRKGPVVARGPVERRAPQREARDARHRRREHEERGESPPHARVLFSSLARATDGVKRTITVRRNLWAKRVQRARNSPNVAPASLQDG